MVDEMDGVDEVGGVDLGDGAQPEHRVIGARYQELISNRKYGS